jgi:hypothetical protein
VANCAIGIDRGNDTAQYLKNNLVDDTDPFYGTFTDNDTYNDYNATSNSGSTNGTHDKINQIFLYVTASGKDFHLANFDTAARDAGTDLSADANVPFSTDIDRQVRPVGGTWDIGADEAGTTVMIKGGVKINGGVKIQKY